jgi:hypothetical protein
MRRLTKETRDDFTKKSDTNTESQLIGILIATAEKILSRLMVVCHTGLNIIRK